MNKRNGGGVQSCECARGRRTEERVLMWILLNFQNYISDCIISTFSTLHLQSTPSYSASHTSWSSSSNRPRTRRNAQSQCISCN